MWPRQPVWLEIAHFPANPGRKRSIRNANAPNFAKTLLHMCCKFLPSGMLPACRDAAAHHAARSRIELFVYISALRVCFMRGASKPSLGPCFVLAF